MKPEIEIIYIKTPLGVAEIKGNGPDVIKISILDPELPVSSSIPDALQDCVTQLEEYFMGKRSEFTFSINPPGTDFQKKVWAELLKIPFGKTTSYLELSKRVGDIRATRAVASANARNPLWIAVPCHRVIGSNNSLTGYAGGLWRKKWLLDHESGLRQETLF